MMQVIISSLRKEILIAEERKEDDSLQHIGDAPQYIQIEQTEEKSNFSPLIGQQDTTLNDIQAIRYGIKEKHCVGTIEEPNAKWSEENIYKEAKRNFQQKNEKKGAKKESRCTGKNSEEIDDTFSTFFSPRMANQAAKGKTQPRFIRNFIRQSPMSPLLTKKDPRKIRRVQKISQHQTERESMPREPTSGKSTTLIEQKSIQTSPDDRGKFLNQLQSYEQSSQSRSNTKRERLSNKNMNKGSSGKTKKKKRKRARRKNKGASKKKADNQGNEEGLFSLF